MTRLVAASHCDRGQATAVHRATMAALATYPCQRRHSRLIDDRPSGARGCTGVAGTRSTAAAAFISSLMSPCSAWLQTRRTFSGQYCHRVRSDNAVETHLVAERPCATHHRRERPAGQARGSCAPWRCVDSANADETVGPGMWVERSRRCCADIPTATFSNDPGSSAVTLSLLAPRDARAACCRLPARSAA
jgi:hypothetical protein